MQSAVDNILQVGVFAQRMKQLRHVAHLRDGKLVPWVGAGLGVPYGLPTWLQFLSGLMDELEQDDKPVLSRLLATGCLDIAADFISRRLGARFKNCLVHAFTGEQLV